MNSINQVCIFPFSTFVESVDATNKDLKKDLFHDSISFKFITLLFSDISKFCTISI
jgi:hypothetical protein